MTGVTPTAQIIQDANDYATEPPPFPPVAPAKPEQHDEELHTELQSLTREQLIARLHRCEQKLRAWNTAASNLVSTIALCPEMTEGFYARMLRDLLADALQTLDAIHTVRHIECSMPSVAAEAPSVDLLEWRALSYSTWHIDWSPSSWWVSVSAVGSRWGLSFNSLATVSAIYLRGKLRCAFSEDLTSLRISFEEPPVLDMNIESSVGWGAVPIPVREQIEHLVREQIVSFVQRRVTGDESMVVVIRRKAREKISEDDLLEARKQAERASTVNLRSSLFL